MILITGATGRVGKALIARLLSQKKYRGKIRVLVRDKSAARKNFGSKVQIYEGDLGSRHDFVAIAQACKNVDMIIHLAALMEYSAPEKDFIRVNVEGIKHLLNAAKLHGCKPKFIFLSSTSIYRGSKSHLINEHTIPRPTNAYGKSKFLAEEALKKSGVKYIILRPPIVYGPDFKTGFGQVIRAIRKGRMPIIGLGKNYIAHIHVDDLVDAINLAINAKIWGEDFLLSSGENKTQKELFTIIAQELKVKAPSLHVPKFLAYSGAGLIHFLFSLMGLKPRIFKEYVHTLAESRLYDISKAKSKLGFEPKVKIREGLRELIRNMKK
jgi:nucleoside-diphosphate-sugar epimerase